MRFYERVMDVYFDDLDSFKILHNARYLLLFERTLGAFWFHLGFGELQNADQFPDRFHLVRSNHVEYLRPVSGVGRVRVRVWVERLGRTSLTFAFRILPQFEDVEYATGSRTVVRVDPDSLEPVPWTAELRRVLGPWTNPAEDP